MSRINEKLIIEKFKTLTKCKNDKDASRMLGISQQNYSHRKSRGTLLSLIAKWGINNDIDLNWLLKDNTMNQQSIDKSIDKGLAIIKDKAILIKEYSLLHSNGYLTKDEYNSIKRDILDSY